MSEMQNGVPSAAGQGAAPKSAPTIDREQLLFLPTKIHRNQSPQPPANEANSALAAALDRFGATMAQEVKSTREILAAIQRRRIYFSGGF